MIVIKPANIAKGSISKAQRYKKYLKICLFFPKKME